MGQNNIVYDKKGMVIVVLLSNNDIRREIVKRKNISIYPLNLENIKGSSINLTASSHAWDVRTKDSVLNENKKKIIIKPKTTVSIFTNEAIWVSRKIGGTYHPRVSLVAKGLSNISTTLDPQWYGLSLITVSNTTDNSIEIRVGEAFVSVMLYYLKTKATKGIIDNQASRPDLYSKFNLEDEDEEFLSKQWHRNYHGIQQKMRESESYKYLVKDKNKFRQNISETLKHPALVAIISAGLAILTTFLINFFGWAG